MNHICRTFLIGAVVLASACTPFLGPLPPDGGDAAVSDRGDVHSIVASDSAPDGSPPSIETSDVQHADASTTGDIADVALDVNVTDAFEAGTPGSGPPGSLIFARSIVLEGIPTSVVALADDTVVVGGTFAGSAHFGPSTTLRTSGDYDLFLAAYTSRGDLRWAIQAGGPMDDTLGGITVLTDGRIAATGSFLGTAVFGQGRPKQTSLQSAGEADIFLATYTPEGDLDFALRSGGDLYDITDGIAARPDGGVVLRGRWQSTTGSGFMNPGQGSFIARLKSGGEPIWTRTFDGGSGGVGGCITVRPDEVTVFCDYTEASVSFWTTDVSPVLVPITRPSQFVVGVPDSGLAPWVNHAEVSGGLLSSNFVVALPGSEVAMGGTLLGPTTFHHYTSVHSNDSASNTTLMTTAEQEGTFVARYDSGGNVLSVSALVATRLSETGGSVEPDGSVVVSGAFEGAFGSMPSVRSAGGADVFAAKVNPDGNVAWISRGGGPGTDAAFAPVVLSDGSIVVAGTFVNTATFGKGEPKEVTVVVPASASTGQFWARFSP